MRFRSGSQSPINLRSETRGNTTRTIGRHELGAYRECNLCVWGRVLRGGERRNLHDHNGHPAMETLGAPFETENRVQNLVTKSQVGLGFFRASVREPIKCTKNKSLIKFGETNAEI